MAPETPATRCRPGDLAIIVGTDAGSSAADLGKLLRVIGPGHDWTPFGDSRHHWRCDTLGQKFAVYVAGEPSFSDGREPVDFTDALLRPIRGDGLAQDVSDSAPMRAEGLMA